MSIYNDFPEDDIIWTVSNPARVRENYHRKYKHYIDLIKKHYNVDSEIYRSSRKDKKYMVFGPIGNSDYLGMIHFGSIHYEDNTKHNDPIRRNSYLKRFNKDLEPYTPYMLSKLLLW